MPEAVLYYFDGRGKAELLRMILCLIKQKFREELMTERKQLLDLIEAGKLQFNQLPLLEINGMNLVQTGAITRYLAKLGGMLGETDKQAVKIDTLFEGTRDFYAMFLYMAFKPEEEVKESIRQKGFPRYLPIYNKLLQNSGTGLLCGPFISLADVGLFEALQATVDYFGKEELKDYEKLLDFYNKFLVRPDMKEYFEKYKKGKNDQKYIDVVKRVFDW